MLNRLYTWYGKRVVLSVAIVIVILVGTGIYLLVSHSKKAEPVSIEQKSVVEVKKVNDIAFSNSFTTVGTVEAVSEAKLQTEAGGRITSVNAKIGDTVPAGKILATIENKSEQAALLQAQGAYEAAVAGSVSGGVSVESAKNGLASSYASGVSMYQNTAVTVDSILHNTIDSLFSINNGTAQGYKLDAGGDAPELNTERTAIEQIIAEWAKNKNTASDKNIVSLLNKAHEDTLRISQFVDRLNTLIVAQKTDESFTEEEKSALQASLSAARLSLNGALQSIEGALVSIDASVKGLEQAQIAGSANSGSASSAQIKIALGSLRAAQANYEKTLVRTPITGVVNALYLKAGEYASPSQPAAIVANNNGLEISTAVNDADRVKLAVGDMVKIGDTASGTITAIAGAIDPSTSKVAVKVSVDPHSDLQNGSTVTLTFTQDTGADMANKAIVVPLSSIKMTANGPVAFTVNDQNKLVPMPLTLGKITGDSVIVAEGLNSDTSIVVDARGLSEGQEVEVTTK